MHFLFQCYIFLIYLQVGLLLKEICDLNKYYKPQSNFFRFLSKKKLQKENFRSGHAVWRYRIEELNLKNRLYAYGLEYLTTQFNTKSVCMVGLHSLDNHLIGVLTISFQDSHRITKDEWIYIRQKVGVVGTLLSEYLYTTNKKK